MNDKKEFTLLAAVLFMTVDRMNGTPVTDISTKKSIDDAKKFVDGLEGLIEEVF